MSHIKNNLNSGEKINYFTKPSIKPFFVFIILFSPMVFLIIWAVFKTSIIMSMIWTNAISGVLLGIELIKIHVSEYAITNKKVISKLGLIRRDIEEMNLQSIESVNLKQSITGRILNYGNIVISGRGSSQVSFEQVDSPVEVRKKIQHKS